MRPYAKEIEETGLKAAATYNMRRKWRAAPYRACEDKKGRSMLRPYKKIRDTLPGIL